MSKIELSIKKLAQNELLKYVDNAVVLYLDNNLLNNYQK